MITRFSQKKVAKILNDRLQKEKDTHQLSGEFVEGCLLCEKCRLIRELIMELGLCELVPEMRMTDRRHFGHKALKKGMYGETIVIDDVDGRIARRRLRG